MKADSDDQVKSSKNPHEKAQKPEVPGPVHAAPTGPASQEGSPGSDDDQQLSSLEDGAHDEQLLRWSRAVTQETRLGLELDAICQRKGSAEEIEAADNAWRAALDRVAQAYEALPTVGDLALTMRLARKLTPTGKERPTVGLGRALAGVTVETQRSMVRLYPPHYCASTADRILSVWADWSGAELEYSRHAGGPDLALRANLRAEVQHYRRLARELLFLWWCAEELRAAREIIATSTTVPAQRMLYDDNDYLELLERISADREMFRHTKFGRLLHAAEQRTGAQAFRTTPYDHYQPPPAYLVDLSESKP